MSEFYCPDCGASLTDGGDVHGHCGTCPVCGLSMCGGWPRRTTRVPTPKPTFQAINISVPA